MRAYLYRVWMGEERLWITFWLFGVVGGIIANIAVMVAGNLPYFEFKEVVIYSLSIFVLVYTAFIIVSFWNSAANYTGPRIWSVLVQMISLINCIFWLALLFQLMGISEF